MPRGHEHDLIYSLSIYACFSDQLFFKKARCAMLGCHNDHLFPKKYTVKFSFCLKSSCNYRASAPWASHNPP